MGKKKSQHMKIRKNSSSVNSATSIQSIKQSCTESNLSDNCSQFYFEKDNLRAVSVLEYAKLSYQVESRYEQNLTSRASQMLTVLSIAFATLLMAVPILLEYALFSGYRVLDFVSGPIKFMLASFLFSLGTLVFDNKRTMDGRELLQSLKNGNRKHWEQSQSDYVCQQIEILAEVQKQQRRVNRIRSLVLCVSICLFLIAVLLFAKNSDNLFENIQSRAERTMLEIDNLLSNAKDVEKECLDIVNGGLDSETMRPKLISLNTKITKVLLDVERLSSESMRYYFFLPVESRLGLEEVHSTFSGLKTETEKLLADIEKDVSKQRSGDKERLNNQWKEILSTFEHLSSVKDVSIQESDIERLKDQVKQYLAAIEVYSIQCGETERQKELLKEIIAIIEDYISEQRRNGKEEGTNK